VFKCAIFGVKKNTAKEVVASADHCHAY